MLNHTHDSKKRELPDIETLYDLSELFKVFGDFARVKILYVLFQQESNVGDIAKIVEMNQPLVSHHLRVLKQARLVKYRRDGKQVIYSMADNHIKNIFNECMEHIIE